MQEEYFRDDFKAASQAYNQASWVYGGEHMAFEGYAKQHLFDADERIDRVAMAWEVYEQPLHDGRFFYASSSEAAYLVKRVVQPVEEDEELGRLLSAHRFYKPMTRGGVRFVPRVEAEATYYSKREDRTIDDLRYGWVFGFESSMRGSRLLSEKHRGYGVGLRHTVKPYLDYQFSEFSTEVDEVSAVDMWDRRTDVNRIRVGLNHLLQTRRKGRVVRLAELDLWALIRAICRQIRRSGMHSMPMDVSL